MKESCSHSVSCNISDPKYKVSLSKLQKNKKMWPAFFFKYSFLIITLLLIETHLYHTI